MNIPEYPVPGGKILVGVDEVGRGPLCGPLVVCAFCFKEKNSLPPIRDSKKTSLWRRQELFDYLSGNGNFSVKAVPPAFIDEHNIFQATMAGFDHVVGDFLDKFTDKDKAVFIIDGPFFKNDPGVEYMCVKKADEKFAEVAAASIIAKVFRDYLMEVMDLLCPEWGLRLHKGYPTKAHRQLLEELCPTPFHRRSFSPVAEGKRD